MGNNKKGMCHGLLILTGRWETVTRAIQPDELQHYHILGSVQQASMLEKIKTNHKNQHRYEKIITGWEKQFCFRSLLTNLKKLNRCYKEVIVVYNNDLGIGYLYVNLLALLLFPREKRVITVDSRLLPLRFWQWCIQVLLRRTQLDRFFFAGLYWLRLWLVQGIAAMMGEKRVLSPGLVDRARNNEEKSQHVLFVTGILLNDHAGVSVRARKFLKYSSEYGFHVHALTTCNTWEEEQDKKNWEEGFKNIAIYGLRWREYLLPKWSQVPDTYASWIFAAIKKGKEIIRSQPVKVIYSTAKPYSDHLVALVLHQVSGLPLVVEFRDEWTHLPFQRYGFPRRVIELSQERKVIGNAAKVITNTTGQNRNFILHYPEIGAERFQVIPNGFDPDDFVGIDTDGSQGNPGKGGKDYILLTYVGNISPIRTLKYLVEGLQVLLLADPVCRERLRFRIVGYVPSAEQEIVRNSGIADMFELTGPVPHQAAIQYMMQSDILISITHRQSHRYIAGKTYEYLYSGKPVLGLVPLEGDAGRLIKEYGQGLLVEPDHVAGIADALGKCYRNILLKVWPRVNPGENRELDCFNRRNLVGEICQVLEKVSE